MRNVLEKKKPSFYVVVVHMYNIKKLVVPVVFVSLMKTTYLFHHRFTVYKIIYI